MTIIQLAFVPKINSGWWVDHTQGVGLVLMQEKILEFRKRNVINVLIDIFRELMKGGDLVSTVQKVKSNPQMADRVWINQPSKFNPHFNGGDFYS